VTLYLWLKAVHILSLIAWMAGMLYLPRLFVYHAEAGSGSAANETFKVMERRLQRAIMLPALILTWVTGLSLAIEGGFLTAGWLDAKFLLVLAMTGLHGYFARMRRDFAADQNSRSPLFYRVVNEVVTVLLIGIVLLVVLKPF